MLDDDQLEALRQRLLAQPPDAPQTEMTNSEAERIVAELQALRRRAEGRSEPNA